MTQHVRFSEMKKKARVIPIREGATLEQVLAEAQATTNEHSQLTQNGRPAALSDAAKPDAVVMLMPNALHG